MRIKNIKESITIKEKSITSLRNNGKAGCTTGSGLVKPSISIWGKGRGKSQEYRAEKKRLRALRQ